MPWRAILESDVLTVINSEKLEGIRAAALADGQPDPVQPTIDQVTDQVRGYVATHNTLGLDGTIPESLIAYALDIIAVRIPMRVDEDPSEGRARLMKDAIRYLERISDGKIDLIDPIEESEEQARGTGVTVVSYRERKAKSSDLDGL